MLNLRPTNTNTTPASTASAETTLPLATAPAMPNVVSRAASPLSDTALASAAAAGDERAFTLLCERYEWLTRRLTARYYLPGATADDVAQEARIGLHQACLGFSPSSGAFPAFAALCAERQVITALKTAQRHKHSPLNESVSLDGPPPGGDLDDDVRLGDALPAADEDVVTQLIARERRMLACRQMDYLHAKLSDLEQAVLLGWIDGVEYGAIATDLGVSSKFVDNALQRVKRKARDAFADLEQAA